MSLLLFLFLERYQRKRKQNVEEIGLEDDEDKDEEEGEEEGERKEKGKERRKERR